MKLRELEKRLEQEPDNLGLRVMVAGALREAGRHGDANTMYASVAVAYRDQGRVQQAIAVCRGALEEAPEDLALGSLLAALSAPPSPPPPPAPVSRPRPVVWPPVEVPRPPVVAQRTKQPSEPPARRSSMDETPLPRPVPYHIWDPTASAARISLSELPTVEGADTRPGSEPGAVRASVAGLASAARRITATLSGDLSAELETRERALLEPHDVARLSEPPTLPTERVAVVEVDEDATTPIPIIGRDSDPGSEEEVTNPHHVVDTRTPIESALFAPLPADKRAGVLARFARRSARKGERVIRQGDISHPLVLVQRGRLEVRAERADGTVALLEALGALDFIGEASLLGRQPAEASVVAASDTELLVLSPHDVFEIAGAFPAWWAHLKHSGDRRTRDYDRRR